MKMLIHLLVSILLLGACTSLPAGLYAGPNVYYSNAIAPLHHQLQSQFHTQDELGQYSYGYSDGLSSKTESKSLDGITHGSYSYLDSNGIVQNVNYIADDINGFRVAASNLPVGPAAVPASQSAIPVNTASALQQEPSAEPEQIYAPVQQIHQPIQQVVSADPGSFHHQQYPLQQYPSVPFVPQRPGAFFNDIVPHYDPNVAADEDSVEVTAAKIFSNLPQPVQDTPEVAAAKKEHMALVQQAEQNNAAAGSADSNNDNDANDDNDSDVIQADPAPPAIHNLHTGAHVSPVHIPVAVAGTGPLRYPYGTYHVQAADNVITQYHSQDDLGQYSYGYSGGPSAKTEVKTLDGITRGSYSYIDANGEIQHVNYIADPANGFRVAASNLPVGPSAPTASAQHESNQLADSPDVARAKSIHFSAHEEARIKLHSA